MSLHSTTDRFIEDIVKAAKESFAQSPRRQPGEALHIQVSGGVSHKLANHAGLGAVLGLPTGNLTAGLTGLPFGSAIGSGVGAALGADEGHKLPAAIGAAGGGIAGQLLGQRAGRMVSPALGQLLGTIGSVGGAALGGHHLGQDELSSARDEGAKAAAARFGVKEAFIAPLLGSIAGPALARAGVGALAKGTGGAALGGMANKILPRIGGGVGGMAFDAATSMAGGALGNKLQSQGPMG